MRSSSKHSTLWRWLLRGSVLFGLPCFVACAGGDSSPGPMGGKCDAPQIDCSGLCADTSNNALHCGGCNQPCGGGEICENSTCVVGSCGANEMMCSGVCVNTQTSLDHCGECDAGCSTGQSCQAGACVNDPGVGGTGAVGGAGGTGALGGAGGTGAMGGTGATSGSGGTGGVGGSSGSGGTAGGSSDECRVWLAPDGADDNDGSEGSPVQTLLQAYELMCPKPADGTPNGAECEGVLPRTICAKPGTYPMTERFELRKTRMGTEAGRLVLQGDPNSAERPLFDFSGQERIASCGANPDNLGGFTINANYVTVRNVEVRGANDNCILVQGGYGLVEGVLTYECEDTGIQVSSGDYEGNILSGTNNTILNCDSHSNYDVLCAGENADGFAIKEGTGVGNKFIGCRAWNNTDDGYDLFAWTSPVVLEDCWAFDQCSSTSDTGSDCNGFKLGGNDVEAIHELSDLIAVGNPGDGFTDNSNSASMTCSGTCASWGNGTPNDNIGNVSESPIGNASVSNMAADTARNADGSLKAPSEL